MTRHTLPPIYNKAFISNLLLYVPLLACSKVTFGAKSMANICTKSKFKSNTLNCLKQFQGSSIGSNIQELREIKLSHPNSTSTQLEYIRMVYHDINWGHLNITAKNDRMSSKIGFKCWKTFQEILRTNIEKRSKSRRPTLWFGYNYDTESIRGYYKVFRRLLGERA